MYILTGSKDQIVNSDFVERFCIAEKNDAALIIASYSTERPPVTLSRYKTKNEAQGALSDLFFAIAGEQTYYMMPESCIYGEEQIKRDSRTKRKGGS